MKLGKTRYNRVKKKRKNEKKKKEDEKERKEKEKNNRTRKKGCRCCFFLFFWGFFFFLVLRGRTPGAGTLATTTHWSGAGSGSEKRTKWSHASTLSRPSAAQAPPPAAEAPPPTANLVPPPKDTSFDHPPSLPFYLKKHFLLAFLIIKNVFSLSFNCSSIFLGIFYDFDCAPISLNGT